MMIFSLAFFSEVCDNMWREQVVCSRTGDCVMSGVVNKMKIGMAASAVAALRLPLPHHLSLLPYPGSVGGYASVGEEKTI